MWKELPEPCPSTSGTRHVWALTVGPSCKILDALKHLGMRATQKIAAQSLSFYRGRELSLRSEHGRSREACSWARRLRTRIVSRIYHGATRLT